MEGRRPCCEHPIAVWDRSARNRSGEIAERVAFGIPDDDAWLAFRATLDAAAYWRWPAAADRSEPHKEGDRYWWLELRDHSRGHRAGVWSHAPERFDDVRAALFELVEQVLANGTIAPHHQMTRCLSFTARPISSWLPTCSIVMCSRLGRQREQSLASVTCARVTGC